MKVLITGGTGTIGSRVVEQLRDAESEVVLLSRNRHPVPEGFEHTTADLSTGEGVEAAVHGADVVVHLAGTAKGDEQKARHLVHALQDGAVRHLVLISVVGAERIPVESAVDRAMFGYFASKRASEEIVMGAGIPWTILRATQVHDSMAKLFGAMTRLPAVPAPSGMRVQPVDTGEVADRLAALALGEPAGLLPDLGGPNAYEMRDLVRTYLTARGKHRMIMPMPMMGGAGAAVRAGANLPVDGITGGRSWEQFLAEEVQSRPQPVAVA